MKEGDSRVWRMKKSSKTLIGLLILQSKINSGEGPCLFICPNIYLVKQVRRDAKKFGINYWSAGWKCVPESNNLALYLITREYSSSQWAQNYCQKWLTDYN